MANLAACQALWDEIAARAYSDPRYAAAHDLAFDAYCMQHPVKYCVSAKSYAAHLTRLCCGIEYDRSPRVYAAIRRWLDGSPRIEKPVVLRDRGDVTVADIHPGASPEEHGARVRAWAQSVWRAYASQQGLAREWIRTANVAGRAGKR